jgi:hypothetical protein
MYFDISHVILEAESKLYFINSYHVGMNSNDWKVIMLITWMKKPGRLNCSFQGNEGEKVE